MYSLIRSRAQVRSHGGQRSRVNSEVITRLATPINFGFARRSKGAAVVAEKMACSSSVLLHYTINVAGMSWPVTYGEVATLVQEFLGGSVPTSEMIVSKPLPTRLISVPAMAVMVTDLDSERSFSCKNNLPFKASLDVERLTAAFYLTSTAFFSTHG